MAITQVKMGGAHEFGFEVVRPLAEPLVISKVGNGYVVRPNDAEIGRATEPRKVQVFTNLKAVATFLSRHFEPKTSKN